MPDKKRDPAVTQTHVMGAGIRPPQRHESEATLRARTMETRIPDDKVTSSLQDIVLAGDELATRFQGIENGGDLDAKLVEWQKSITRADNCSRYMMDELLGLGAQGFVFSVKDNDCGRNVALKTMRGEDRSAAQVARFIHEAQVTAQLEHPGIVPVYELNEFADGTLFYTMQSIGGRSLADELRQRSEDSSRRLHFLEIFLKVCDTMSFAHARGVVHRDLKPANIMVGAYGEVMVLDWGLSKVLGEADVVSLRSQNAHEQSESGIYVTRDGQAVGTPAYMSPEQANGHRDSLDERSDVYGLGVILYEMLAQKIPYTGSDVESVLSQVSQGVWVPLDQQLAAYDESVQVVAIVHKAMSTRPEDRYQTVREMAVDLRASMDGEAISAYADTALDQILRYMRRHRASLKTAFFVISFFLCTGIAGLWYTSQQQEQHAFALEKRITYFMTHGKEEEALVAARTLFDADNHNIFAQRSIAHAKRSIAEQRARERARAQQATADKERIAQAQAAEKKEAQRAQRYQENITQMQAHIDNAQWTAARANYNVALVYSPAGEKIITEVLQDLRTALESAKAAAEDAAAYVRKMNQVDVLVAKSKVSEQAGRLENAQLAIESALDFLPPEKTQRRAELRAMIKVLSEKIVTVRVSRERNIEKEQLRALQDVDTAEAQLILQAVRQAMEVYAEAHDVLLKKRLTKDVTRSKLEENSVTFDVFLAIETEIAALEQAQLVRRVDMVQLLHQAQLLAPQLLAVKHAFAAYYAQEVRMADERGDHTGAEIAAAHGVELDVENESYSRIFAGLGAVVNESDTAVLRIFAVSYADNGTLLAASEPLFEVAAQRQLAIPIGHYILRYAGVTAADGVDMYRALILKRGDSVLCSDTGLMRFHALRQRIAVGTRSSSKTVFDLAYVPGARVATVNGQMAQLPDLAVCRYEVGFGDYIQFLNDTHRTLVERERDVPRIVGGKRLLKRDSKGVYHLRYMSGKAPLQATTPVYAITHDSAERYCEWMRQRTGLQWRLPTQVEWQLIAHGGDERLYPWGNHPDYVPMCYSAKTHDVRYNQVARMSGSFPLDRTVQGVYDCAGSLSEMVAASASSTEIVICGGNYSDTENNHFETRAIRRLASSQTFENRVGFRLVISLGE